MWRPSGKYKTRPNNGYATRDASGKMETKPNGVLVLYFIQTKF